MQVTFKCECGTRLKCSCKGIGRVLPCPYCDSHITVPTPSVRQVRRFLTPLPYALPEKTVTEYSTLIVQVYKFTERNVRICKESRHPSEAAECVDQAKRILRNIAVFVNDIMQDPIPEDFVSDECIVSALASVAIGHDFGGVGTSKAKARQYERWLRNQKEQSSPQHDHPMRSQVFATISAVESFLE